MGAALDTPEGERLDVLVTLVEAYERRHYPMEPPDPVEALKFRLEQMGLTPRDHLQAGGGARLGRAFSAFREAWFESDYMGWRWTPRPGAEA